MPDGRGARVALEAAFLVAVAAVLGLARVDPVAIVFVMLLAWAIVALLEWVSWRDEPHWASGSPPRYYVPEQRLPPRPPSRELPAFTVYPRPPRETTEAPTWIAPPEMREELLRWPAPVAGGPDELPQELLAEAAAAVEPEPAGWPVPRHDEDTVEESGWDDVGEETDPWAMEESVDAPEPGPAPAPAPTPAPAPAATASVVPLVPAPGARLARHRLDPFEEPASRRRPWRRRLDETAGATELPVLPVHVAVPPREADA